MHKPPPSVDDIIGWIYKGYCQNLSNEKILCREIQRLRTENNKLKKENT